MFEPLNKTLYELLEREFGDVIVAAEGEELIGTYEGEARRQKAEALVNRRKVPSTKPLRPKLDVLHSGEEYRVNCPYCNDTRHRLFINHLWAVKDRYGNQNLWLAHCWNEECLASYTRQQQLWDRVFRIGRRPPGHEEVRKGRKIDINDIGGVASPPGPIISLKKLRKNNPNHQAIAYLEGRGFDCDKLSEIYEVGWCSESQYALACNRIYIPIRIDGILRGWQMRLPRDWQEGDPPKYWSMPNMRRRLLAYNYDRATYYKTPVIIEGPADVWSYGTQSMGCIGKTMSPALVNRLRDRCGDGSIVVMLDPNPDKKAKERMGDRYVHHIEKLAKMLEGPKKDRFKLGVCRVYLPLDTDPGSLDPDYMRDYIRDAAKEQGVKISFKKRIA